ncbi:MAG: hypothetical protein NTY46_00170 [Candidatus Sumerlaeota bacterium]|nr:hypothetical protein [Candidatus Sumerlaeota bacterium]
MNLYRPEKVLIDRSTENCAHTKTILNSLRGVPVVSWSVNSHPLIRSVEHKAASFDERLAAACRCVRVGYRVGFHFDPIIRHEDMARHYAETINTIFDTVPESSIVWISMGALHFPPPLKQIIGPRFPNSRFIYDEFVRDEDGKMRCFRPLRVEMYRMIAGAIRARNHTVRLYLRMETPEIWRDVFATASPCQRELASELDGAVSCAASSR